MARHHRRRFRFRVPAPWDFDGLRCAAGSRLPGAVIISAASVWTLM
jgi:hypothetical protein